MSSETAIQDELNRQHVFEFCSPDVLDLIVQINMADDDTLTKLLELYQNCNSKGDRASLLLETNAGVSVGNGSSEQRRRRKPPSQIKRDNKRMDEFLAEKLEIRAAMEEKDTVDDVVKAERVILVDLKMKFLWRCVKNSSTLQK